MVSKARRSDRPNPAKRPRPSVNWYSGHVIHADEEIDVISNPAALEGREFYANYVSKRKPVKIIAADKCPISIDDFRADNLDRKLQYGGILQVERKHNGGFGSGMKREKMPLKDLLATLQKGDDTYYLTTQYDENGDSEDETDENDEESEENGDFGEESDEENVKEKGLREDGLSENGESDESDDFDGQDGEISVLNDQKLPKHQKNPAKNPILDDSEDEGTPLVFSETSSIGSIDMNDLHDDFEEENDDFDDSSDAILDEKLQLSLSEAQSRVRELLQPPLTNLCLDETFPLVPDFLSGLIPQQINLWMGCGATSAETPDFDNLTEESLGKYLPPTKNGGSSSGLHHDHADNLYILIQGIKRFTLFSPADAQKLHTIGLVHKIYENGLIDYEINEFSKNWKHVRNDGAILKSVAEWMLDKNDFSVYSQKQLQDLVDEPEPAVASDKKYDPPNFSKIPPALLHLRDFDSDAVQKLKSFSEKHFPGFLDLHSVQVWLKPGEMLYLPAGWFHEVTSFGQENADPIHIALNYWFIPPTNQDAKNAYPDAYWAEDHARTAAAVALAKQRAFSFF